MLAVQNGHYEDADIELEYIAVTVENIAHFRTLNGHLFPVTYPESFYRSILHSPAAKAFIVKWRDQYIGSYSVRAEPVERWNALVSGSLVDNYSPVQSVSQDCVYYIMTFGVLAAYRQLGIGSVMLQKIIRDAQTADNYKVGLHVHIDNAAALKFYIRRGFKTVGRADNYYVRIVPNSAYILELDLRTSSAT